MKWIAVCSNGAVALGAYEAGVLAQLYADVCTVNGNGDIVGIDAIAGASAGAVTGALLAQAVVTRATPAVFTQRLQQLWIAGLSADELLGNINNSADSLFDPATLNNLAPKVLLNDAAVKAICQGQNPPPVTLSIALTNIDGIPYEITLKQAKVVASLYADYETLIIEGGVPYIAPGVEALAPGNNITKSAASWSDVQELAITSGAFPVAFKSQILERDLSQYADAVYPPGNPKHSFNYVDGGVLNNDPVGRAIDAATFQEELFGHSNDARTFIVIEPDPTTDQDALTALANVEKSLDKDGVPLMSLGGKVIGAYFNDALYRDLKQAIDTNTQIAAMNAELDPLVAAGTITQAQAAAIRKAVGLDYKKAIDIERIPSAPRQYKLAGAFASHFGGFLDQSYRTSDFAVGCFEARRWFTPWIESQVAGSAAQLGVKLESGSNEDEQPTPPKPGGFVGITASDLNATKDKIADRVEVLAEHALESSGLWGVVERPLFALGRHIVREELDKLMT